VLDSLTELVSGSPWAYAIVFAVAALDAVFPLVPSETVLVAAGALAGSGKLELPLVLIAAAAGALIGDNTAYALGRLLGPRLEHRAAGGKLATRLAWARRQLDEHGASVIVVGRFVPGGRTAVTLSAGALAMPWRRFFGYDVAAAAIWACYGGSIGYFGGTALEGWKGLMLALGIAFVCALGVEQARRWVRRRRPSSARR
jgi:membrane-associated protein